MSLKNPPKIRVKIRYKTPLLPSHAKEYLEIPLEINGKYKEPQSCLYLRETKGPQQSSIMFHGVANLYFTVSTITFNSLSLTKHNIDILERNTCKKMQFKYEIIIEGPI
jgi:hypothetical protein